MSEGSDFCNVGFTDYPSVKNGCEEMSEGSNYYCRVGYVDNPLYFFFSGAFKSTNFGLTILSCGA